MNIWKALADLLYPPKCVFCRRLLPRGTDGVCAACERTLPYNDTPRSGPFFEICIAPLRYEGVVRDALHRYKFGGLSCYASALAVLVADAVRASGIEADLVTWVPVSRKRRKKRGYDQAELLARNVAKRLALPCAPLLQKTVDNPAQSGLGAAERRGNVLGVYRAENPGMIAGARILLVDDIVTTGSTLSECSRVLLTAGAAPVSCAAVAGTADGQKEQVE